MLNHYALTRGVFISINSIDPCEFGVSSSYVCRCKTIENINHIAWATGGSMVPKDIMDEYYNKGISLLK